MSDVETAQTGAIAAPVENTTPTQEQTQAPPQESAPADTDELQDGQPREKDGKFGSFQKRINELTKEKYEERRARSELEQQVKQLREQFDRATQPAPPAFEDDPQAYFAHIAREEARSYIATERQTATQQQEQQRFQSLAQQLNTREAEYAVTHPDYPEAAEALASVMGPNPMLFEVIATSDHGPAVAHYLGNHLDEAANISRMPPHLAAAAVARLEAKVSAPKHKPVSAAPAPAPVVTGASVASRGANDGQSIDDWMRERNQH